MKIKQTSRNVLNLIRNPFFKLVITSLLYIAWVQWLGHQWLLLGIIIIADIYLTKFVNWRFWRRRKPAGKKYKLSTEIIDSLIIALILAVFIRIFFAEAYTIPTSSMEKTLAVGDYIFVSKLRYGPRLPLTPVTIPFTHNTMPFTINNNSFSDKIQLRYRRLQGYAPIKNYEIVVFNYPQGDSVIEDFPEKNYYQMVRQNGRKYVFDNYHVLYRPIDKRDNYMKRVIGIPGDTVQIIHGRAYVNDLPEPLVPGKQYNYSIKAKGSAEDTVSFKKLDIALYDINYNIYNSIYNLPLTSKSYHTLLDSAYFKAIVKYESVDPSSVNTQIFPYSKKFFWTEDNYGPVIVPKKGETIHLSIENLPLYEKIIGKYEKNDLTVENDSIFINHSYSDEYTFRMDYYFMMGDNRHNSNDSRYWGFVPENHIIGKATFVWLSLDKGKSFLKGLRWERMFRKIE